jgi:hypothetical protein
MNGLGTDVSVYGPATPEGEYTIGSVVPLSTGGYAQVGEGSVLQSLANQVPGVAGNLTFGQWFQQNQTTVLILGAVVIGLMVFSGGRR